MFHLRVKIIGRSGGRSAGGAVAYRAGSTIAAATIAYRAGEKMVDPNSKRVFDYRAKGRLDAHGYGVRSSEIMAPPNAPAWVYDLQTLVNRVEASEKRKDAQLFRELEISLPRELSPDDQRALVRAFVERTCIREGMVAAIFIHNERASDGGDNPHAHVILTMRSLERDGFGPKVRAWNQASRVKDWREAWAEFANDYLMARGHGPRLDPRSHKERGLEVEPDSYIGPKTSRSFDGVIVAHREATRDAARSRNFDKAWRNPAWVLDQITRTQSTFTAQDVARFIHRCTALAGEDDRFSELYARVMASPHLREVAKAETGKPARYSTHAMVAAEADLKHCAARLIERTSAALPAPDVSDVALSPEQQQAARGILQGPDLVALHGLAGTGKSHLLAHVAAEFQAAGHWVRGAALSAIVARNLGEGAGIESQTIASLLKDLDRTEPYEPLQRGDVLIIDEAGMVGSRQLGALLGHAARAGAKVVLVGDTRQLQAIEAGGAFRAIIDRFGAQQLKEIRRQSSPWQRQASADLARGAVAEALATYRAQGHFHAAPDQAEAMAALVAKWAAERHPDRAQLILAHRRTEVEALNRLARSALRDRGLLGPDVKVEVTVVTEKDGEAVQKPATRRFATGDRLLFTKNDRGLRVQNGTLGTILELSPEGEFRVRLDDGRDLTFAAQQYNYLEQGYAMTVHKAQGSTVDRAYVLASEMFDAHLAYVALTRHRDRVDLFYNRTDFPTDAKLLRKMGRDRQKDTTLDYVSPSDAVPTLVLDADLPRLPPGVITSGPISGDWSLMRGQQRPGLRLLDYGIGE